MMYFTLVENTNVIYVRNLSSLTKDEIIILNIFYGNRSAKLSLVLRVLWYFHIKHFKKIELGIGRAVDSSLLTPPQR